MIDLREVGVTVAVWTAEGRRSSRTLLEDVTLRLSEKRVAIIGDNGSGKSTLLRLLNGLVRPSSGSVVVDGLDSTRDAAALRRHVGFVFTDPLSQLLAPTPVDDLSLSLRRSVPGRRERRQAALEVLQARGLEHVADQSVYDLSGGERQQVALASVLAVRPGVVVADEPTTLLDLRNTRRVQAELLGLDQQLVYATHDLAFAARADRGVVIADGRVAFDGPAPDAVAFHERQVER